MSGTTEGTAAGNGDREGLAPAQLLDELHVIRDRTSATVHGYWLPLLLFGALICGSLPFYERRQQPRLSPAGEGHVTVVTALGYYWQVAILVGVVLTMLWYRWRGSRVGLRTPARGFLITGLVLGELVLLVPLLAAQSSSSIRLGQDTHQAGPLVIIAVLLWILGWAERSPALAITVAFYLAAALVVSQYNDSGLAGPSTRAADLSLTALRLLGLLPALVLLVGGSGAWLTQRLHLPAHGAADDH